jgi:hypothetical protein
MLMKRFLCFNFALILAALNAATPRLLPGGSVEMTQVVPVALIINVLGGFWLWSSLTELPDSPALSFCTASTLGQLP